MANPELEKVLDAAWAKGFAFGKYTQDIPLSPEIIALLESSWRHTPFRKLALPA